MGRRAGSSTTCMEVLASNARRLMQRTGCRIGVLEFVTGVKRMQPESSGTGSLQGTQAMGAWLLAGNFQGMVYLAAEGRNRFHAAPEAQGQVGS